MQENKTKNYEVTVTGRADISALSECERQIFYTTLLSRITELMWGGEK